MSIEIGNLLIGMQADVARLQSDMNKAVRIVDDSTKSIQRAANMAKNALELIGVGVSVGAFVGFIKHSIDAADSLNDLSQKVGVNIQTLAGYKLAADQSGTSLEAVAKGIKGLSGNIVENSDKLAKLGITAKDTDGAMLQVADLFASLPDGVEKTTLAVKLFGKAGMDMIPMLNGGSAGLAEAQARAAEYGQRMAELAPQADKFNDNLALLKLNSEGFGITLANQVMPELIGISQKMADASKEGGILNGVLAGLVATWKALFSDDLLSREQQIADRLNALRGHQKDQTRDPGSWFFRADLANKDNQEMLALEKELEQIRKKKDPVVTERTPEQIAAEIKKQRDFTNEVRKILGDWGGGDLPKKAKTDPNATAVASMQDEAFRKQMELLGVAPAQIKVYELAMKGATQAQIEAAQAAADQSISIEAQIKLDKDAAKSAEEASKARLKAIDDANRLLADISPQAKANQEWERLLELQRQAVDENGRQILSAEDLGKAYDKTMSGIKNNGEDAFRSLESAVRGWGDQFTNTFADMVHTGKLSFSSLADSVLRDIERIVIQTQITKPLLDNLFGANYGTAGNNTMGGIVGDIWGGIKGIFNANGNVYSGPGIGAFSSTVVDRPTLFPFARGVGLMGEAGPEAILPLKRINGKLGVQSDGAGSGVTVNIINQAGAKVSTQERRDQNGAMSLDVIIEQVEGGLARNISRGSGELSGTLERTFGLNRTAGAFR